ncbi:PD-(D/E)XK motif protein [Roseateles oligotrophus]|uniref:PD-(D/E)XK motif protein n=1 Tax=Roseateles oligotrophus TaxID=1769250 RepID=A0ABT2YCB2_9BURK|nr:PD-(D/E)XK motif protein [Roseateles oligotrophus]MCV2367672.1 PD-(D/E)XK motif protein [Roseateles oligotrophus]
MTRIEELWRDALQQVIVKPIEADGYRLTRMAPESRFDIYGGVDSTSFVLLAVGIQARPPNIATDSSSLDYFRQQRKDGSWLMVLRLRQNGLETVFGRLCQDLVDAAEGVPDEKALVSLFRERLNLWKKLFQHSGSGFLLAHEIKGLIAEMLTLEILLQRGERDLLETVSGWVGPLGSDQDFVYSDQAIEVKAVGLGVDSISISSLDQLHSEVRMHLVLATLRLATPGEHCAIGLNGLTARIEGLIAESPEALNTFKDRLLEARYVEHEFYDTILFEPTSIDCYAITDEFPKLIRAMVPKGIGSATYSIGIDWIKDFRSDMPT